MRMKRDLFENIVADIIARFLIGSAIGGLIAFRILPEIAANWDDLGWRTFLIPIGAGALGALLLVRRGPGAL